MFLALIGRWSKPQEQQRERPVLNLQKRTKPLDESQPTSTSSIFGGAKPVDTAAKQREIEERLDRENCPKYAGGNRRRDDRAEERPRRNLQNKTVPKEEK